MEKDIGRITKNDTTEVVVRVDDFGGNTGLTIREFVKSDRYTGFTKSGVRIGAKDFKKFKEMINSIDEKDMAEAPKKESEQGKLDSEEMPDYWNENKTIVRMVWFLDRILLGQKKEKFIFFPASNVRIEVWVQKMKSKKLIYLLIVLFLVLSGIILFGLNKKPEYDSEINSESFVNSSAPEIILESEITEERAKEIALNEVPGEVTDIDLEKKSGEIRYVVEIMSEEGIETDVIIDIKTGEVLGIET